MAVIDIEVYKNSTNITDNVVKYSREGSICNSIFTGEMILADNSDSVDLWDIITIYEYGKKRCKMIVQTKTVSKQSGEVTLSLQDYSKKLSDYLITDIYNTENTLSYAKEWIELFLTEAGVSYSITASGDGGVMSNYTSLGMQMAFDQIMTLLQMSGWYMYFDQNGKAIIDNMSRRGNKKWTIRENKILQISRALDDSILRNRAVVYGSSTGDGGWVHTDISRKTPWQIDNKDYRAVVLANPNIYSQDDCDDLALEMLNTFCVVKDEKTVVYVEDPGIKLGDFVNAESSRAGTVRGIVTDIGVSASQDGLIYTVVLDKKCPRLFSYFGLGTTTSGWVYTGHWGHGVWKKELWGQTWYDDSYGLENLYVKDLFIKNDLMACVTDDGYAYTKDVDGYWAKYEHPELKDELDNLYLPENIKAHCCSINDLGEVVVGYNLINPEGLAIPGTAPENGEDICTKSWVLSIDQMHNLNSAHLVTWGDYTKLNINDLEAGYDFNVVGISGVYPSGITPEYAATQEAFSSIYGGIAGYGHGIMTNSINTVDNKHVSGITGYTYLPTSRKYNLITTPPIIGLNDKVFFVNIDRDILTDHSSLYIIDPNNIEDDDAQEVILFHGPPEWQDDDYLEAAYLAQISQSESQFKIACIFSNGIDVDNNQILIKICTLNTSSHTIGTAVTAFDSRMYADEVYIESCILCNGTLSLHLKSMDGTAIDSLFAVDCNILSGGSLVREYATSSDNFLENTTFSIHTGSGLIRGVFAYEYKDYIEVLPGNLYHPDPFTVPTKVDIFTITDKYGKKLIVTEETILEGIDSINIKVAKIGLATNGYSSGIAYGGISVVSATDYYTILWMFLGAATTANDTYGFNLSNGVILSRVKQYATDATLSDIPTSRVCYPISSKYNQPYYVRDIGYGDVYDRYLNLVYSPDSSTKGSTFNLSTIDYGNKVLVGSGSKTLAAWTDLSDMGGSLILESTGRAFSEYNHYFSAGKCLIGVYVESDPFSASHIILGKPIYIEFFLVNTIDDLGISAVLKHTVDPTKAAASTEALSQYGGLFESIYNTVATCNIDISNVSPTVIYSKSYDSEMPGVLATSWTNELDSFSLPEDPLITFDAKTLSMMSDRGFVVASGSLTSSDGFYSLLFDATLDEIKVSDVDFTTEMYTLVYSAGIVHKVELTNYVTPDPFTFFTVSGIFVGENLNPVFFQKFPTGIIPYFSGMTHEEYPTPSGWYDYSDGLPNSDITIIRVDDII